MQLTQTKYTPKQHSYLTVEELTSLPLRDEIVFDTECYPNYWLFALKHLPSGKVFTLEQSEDENLNEQLLLWVMYRFTIVSFNGISYDLPMIWAAYKNAYTLELKRLSDEIINEERRPYGEDQHSIDHIDIIEVCPAPKASLKIYAGRLHCKRLQSLPYPPDTFLTKEQRDHVKEYCMDDLDDLELDYEELRPQIALRSAMSKQYGMDLRSKSDAQIAETVIVSEVAKEIGYMPRRPRFNQDLVLRYQAPEYLRLNAWLTRPALDLVESLEFKLDKSGSPLQPDKLKGFRVRIGNGLYKMGIGGLHSTEKKQFCIADDTFKIYDRDVTSYYPAVILSQCLYPKQLTQAFLYVYNNIVEKRLKAKREKDMVTANALKITINGSFGKFGSMHSKLYSPNLLLAVTITGQLSLLLYIEMLEDSGIHILSANTDGIVIKVPNELYETYVELTKLWESITGFDTEETEYTHVFSRDVNSYFAIKPNGERKGKNQFARLSTDSYTRFSKNPKYDISKIAVVDLITKGTPLRKTITGCTDITKFVCIRAANGSAHKNGVHLGKAVRWYYAKHSPGSIKYVTTGNTVPETEGAKPLMELPDTFPDDVDYNRYIIEAERILDDIGYKQLSLF